ncbi:UDP-N-acetylglucosamine 4,6-dehydratase family protein [Brevundimonas sp.]|uniref:UDP-N-acetylglucosamine 4,6-dehydratase family protein n=1 Tax=Brevundimonas sp. TaxID=1871086 RepID=UPI0035B1547D
MSKLSLLLLRGLKIGARAAIRFAAVVGGYMIASGHAFSIATTLNALQDAALYAGLFAVLGFVLDNLFRTDKALWRYVSIVDVGPIIRTSVLSTLIFLALTFLLDRGEALPRSTLLFVPVLDVGMTLALVLLRRMIHDKEALVAIAPFLSGASRRTPLIVLGDMGRADTFLRELARGEQTYQPIGIVTRTPGAATRQLRGVRVLDSVEVAADLMDDMLGHGLTPAMIFVDDQLQPSDFGAERLGQLRLQGVKLLTVSSPVEVGGTGEETALREFALEELLARPPVQLDDAPLRALVAGRRVLVTGAGGSIGSEVCRQVAGLGCAHLALLDSAEFSLFSIDQEIGHRWPELSRAEYLHDVRNGALLTSCFDAEKPDIVFHAAALKHVPMMERHPCESVLTNVVGTWNVAEAANAAGVKHMVFISTDKAVDPPNVMGATKRLAEGVIRAQQTGAGNTRFSVVRFGNVLGSAGSVVPTFRAQIERGGPVTLTHAEIERYFMTIPEAVQLVLHATAHSAEQPDGPLGVFVLDMGKPVKIIDLARQLIGLYGKVPDKDIAIQITGLRPGEKLFEELVDSSEVSETAGPSLMRVTDRIAGARMTEATVRALEQAARSGDNAAARILVFDVLAKVRAVETGAVSPAKQPVIGA